MATTKLGSILVSSSSHPSTFSITMLIAFDMLKSTVFYFLVINAFISRKSSCLSQSSLRSNLRSSSFSSPSSQCKSRSLSWPQRLLSRGAICDQLLSRNRFIGILIRHKAQKIHTNPEICVLVFSVRLKAFAVQNIGVSMCGILSTKNPSEQMLRRALSTY